MLITLTDKQVWEVLRALFRRINQLRNEGTNEAREQAAVLASTYETIKAQRAAQQSGE